jgi:hypothetical protein
MNVKDFFVAFAPSPSSGDGKSYCSEGPKFKTTCLLSVVLLGCLLITGCGDKSDPEAVSLNELKNANGLRLVDYGSGVIRLLWRGMNNNEDFSGYNVYGKKDADGSFATAHQGKVIELLNDEEDPIQAARDLISSMGYNGLDWESEGSATNADGDFQAIPYYEGKNSDDEPIIPTCLPAATTGKPACTVLTEEGGKSTFNGETYLDLKGLKTDSKYCFTVLATIDDGKKVAPTTSEVRCVVPKSEVSVPNAKAEATKYKTMDFKALRESCATGTCDATTLGDLSAGVQGLSAACDNATATAACLESFSGNKFLTAGKNSAIQDVGYYPDGFLDSALPVAPELKAFGTVQNPQGYSLSGQSILLETEHLYVVAEGTSDSPTAFYYHWVYVTIDSADAITMTIRVSNVENAR